MRSAARRPRRRSTARCARGMPRRAASAVRSLSSCLLRCRCRSRDASRVRAAVHAARRIAGTADGKKHADERESRCARCASMCRRDTVRHTHHLRIDGCCASVGAVVGGRPRLAMRTARCTGDACNDAMSVDRRTRPHRRIATPTGTCVPSALSCFATVRTPSCSRTQQMRAAADHAAHCRRRLRFARRPLPHKAAGAMACDLHDRSRTGSGTRPCRPGDRFAAVRPQ